MHLKQPPFVATIAFFFSLFLTLSAHAQDEGTYVTRAGDGLDNIARGFCHPDRNEIHTTNWNAIGPNPSDLKPNVRLIIQNRCKIGILDATQSTASPFLYTVNGTAQLSTTIWDTKLPSEIWVYATDGSGRPISQRVRADQRLPGNESSQPWSAQLTVQAAPGTSGKVVAEGRNHYAIVRAESPITFGQAQTQVSITHPPEGHLLPGRFAVSGTIQGIELKEIPVLAVDASTNVLAAALAPVRMIDSSAGRRGTWTVEMNVDRTTRGEIQVGTPGTSVYMSRTVIFTGAGDNPSLPMSTINRFTVDRQQINLGEYVNFAWDLRNAQTVYFFRGSQELPKRDGNQYGPQFSDCPIRSSTYRLHVAGTDGGTESRTLNVWVGERQRGGPGPVIASFDANPTSVNPNQPCTTLTWTINEPGNTRMTLYRNNFVIAWPVEATPYVDCVPASEMGQGIVYRLQLDSELSGSTFKTVKVISENR